MLVELHSAILIASNSFRVIRRFCMDPPAAVTAPLITLAQNLIHLIPRANRPATIYTLPVCIEAALMHASILMTPAIRVELMSGCRQLGSASSLSDAARAPFADAESALLIGEFARTQTRIDDFTPNIDMTHIDQQGKIKCDAAIQSAQAQANNAEVRMQSNRIASNHSAGEHEDGCF